MKTGVYEYFWSYLAQFFLEWEMFQSCRANQNVLCSITFLFSENRGVYEVMCKNIVETGRPQMKIWRMRIAGWIPRNIAPIL